jgi:hypothetical protein
MDYGRESSLPRRDVVLPKNLSCRAFIFTNCRELLLAGFPGQTGAKASGNVLWLETNMDWDKLQIISRRKWIRNDAREATSDRLWFYRGTARHAISHRGRPDSRLF